MIPREFERKTELKQYKRWPYVLAIVLFVVVDIAIGYLLYLRYFTDNSGESSMVTTSGTPDMKLTQISSSGEKTESPTTNEIEQIQSLADSFMQARLKRNYEMVKPYVTGQFLDKYDQNVFVGTSSPALDDYEITDTKYIGANTYQIIVQTKWTLNGDEAGNKDWTLIATKNKKDYQINDYSEK